MAAALKCFSTPGLQILSVASRISIPIRSMAKLKIKAKTRHPYVEKQYKPFIDFLSTRGFLRPYKAYDPPEDTKEKINNICARLDIKCNKNVPIEDPGVRFSLMAECYKEFNHSIPNSLLHTIETINDIVEFYNTKVDVTTPYDTLKTMDLPKNLHIQQDYHRFHPETDTMFGGISAFPESSTIVSGLKYRKKYPGYEAKPALY